MTEFASTRFHATADDLAAHIQKAIAEFGEQHGHKFDPEAMASQSHMNLRDFAQEALTFGLGIWAGEERGEEDRPNNVLPFVVAFGKASHGRRSSEGSLPPVARISDSR